MAPRRITGGGSSSDTRAAVYRDRENLAQAYSHEKRIPQTRAAEDVNGVTSIDGVPLSSYGYLPGSDGTFSPANNVGNPPLSGTVSTTSETGSQHTQAESMPTTLATAAIAAIFAVIALCLLAGATWFIIRLRKRRRARTSGDWSMVKPSMRTLNISAPMPLSSTGPYSHLSDFTRMSIAPRPAPTRKPVPKFVVGEDDASSTKPAVRDIRLPSVHASSASVAPTRPVRQSTMDSSEEGGDLTPTLAYLRTPIMKVEERPESIAFSVAPVALIYSKPKPAPLRSAPAAALIYPHETLLDEPSPFIRTAPLIPVTNPFIDPIGHHAPSSVLEGNRDPQIWSENKHPSRTSTQFSIPGTVTAMSTAASADFLSTEMPQFDNRSPPSMPVSALGTAETMTEARFNAADIEDFSVAHPIRSDSKVQVYTPRSRASRPPVPPRLSIFPYALPNISVAPSSASTVALSIRANSPIATQPGTASSSATLAVQQTATAASRTSELLDALGLGMHTPAFNTAGFERVQDLRDQSPHRLRKIAPEMTTEEAENLTLAVDDALKASVRK